MKKITRLLVLILIVLLKLARAQISDAPLLNQEDEETTLEQPADPSTAPTLTPTVTEEEETTPSAASDRDLNTATKPSDTTTKLSDGIVYDPNKAVVRPAKVKPTTVSPKPRAVPPPPIHSANPEKDLFEHAGLVAKYELWLQAERQYRRYVEAYPRGPNAPAAYYGLAESCLKLGRFAESEATYRALLTKFNRGDYVGSAAYRLADSHYARKEFETAAKYFRTAEQHSAKELVRQSATFFRARCMQELGSTRTAESLYRRLSTSQSDHRYRDASLIILARLDVGAGRKEDAYTKFTSLAEGQPAPNIRAEAMTKAGLVGADLGHSEAAQAYFEEVLKLDTTDAKPWHPKAFWGLLHLYYIQEEYQDLIDQYQTRRISYSSDHSGQGQGRVLLMVAHAFRHLERYRQAASLYGQVVRLDPEGKEVSEAGYRQIYCLYRDQSPFLESEIEEYLNRQGKVDARHRYYHLSLLLKAEALFSRPKKTEKTFAEAAATYDGINLGMIPDKYHAWVTYKSAWAHIDAGDYDKGVTAFYTFMNNHAEKHPELVAKVLAKRGEAFRKVKDYRNAIKDFDEIIVQNRDEKLVYLAMQQKALIMVERENPEGTIDSFEALLTRFPEGIGSSEANFFIGDAKYKLTEYKEAVPFLTKARDLDPDTYTIPATRRIIVSYWRLSDPDKAAEAVDLLLAKDPKTNLVPPKLWLWLGTRFFQRNRYEESARYLKQVANPSAPKDTWPLAWSFLGRSYLESGKYEESIPPFDHYLASNPTPDERAKVLLQKATALVKIGKLKEAQVAAEEVHQLQKQGRTYGKAWILLGDIAMAQKDFEKASNYYVIPSKLFKDPLVTPIAMEKAAIASDKMDNKQRAADLRRQLRKEWPNFKPSESDSNA